MKLNELQPAPGAVKAPFRKGRGIASGNGKTSGRGHKGQGQRSGASVRRGFEGGQMPLHQRIPKRGFTNIFAKKFAIVNVSDLNVFEDGSVVNAEVLLEKRIIREKYDGLRVLGYGELSRKLTVQAAKFSGTAEEKIQAAGGKAEVI